MRAVVRRWSGWIARRATADVAGVCGAVGAAVGLLAGWLGPGDADRLTMAATVGGAGAALGGGLGLVGWALCGLVVRRSLFGPADLPSDAETVAGTGTGVGTAAGAAVGAGDEQDLLDEFRTLNRAQMRSQWRVLLDGRGRLDAGFTCYRRIAPPRAFTGSLRHRSDLIGALDAAAAPGGGPRLLIVGPPGYGKTVALLDVAQHLADGYRDRFGVGVLLNLGSWKEHDDDLVEWIVRELCAATGPLPGADVVVRQWTTAGRIAPVLDGLDEVIDPARRRRCVVAINAFIDGAPDHTAVVVASRPDEYAEVSAEGAGRLAVNAALELGRLRRRLVAVRLRDVRGPGDRLADLAGADPTHPAVEVLRAPLWLWIAGTLDRDDAENLAAASDGHEARAILTTAYVARAVVALDREVSLGAGSCRRLLVALAGFLADPRSPDSTTFHLENLTTSQPTQHVSRVATVGGSMAYALAGSLVVGPAVALPVGLAVGVLGVVLGAGADARPARSRIRWPGVRATIEALAGGLAFGAAAGLIGGLAGELLSGAASSSVAGLIGGLAFGVAYGLITGLARRLMTGRVVLGDSLDEARRRSWHSVGWHVATFGLLCGVIGGLVSGEAATGLVFGMVYGLVGGLARRCMASHVVLGDSLDEGRRASQASVGLHFASFGVVCGVAGGLVVGLTAGLVAGLAVGLVRGANAGGWYLFLQRQVRRRARRRGLLAPDPAAFLGAAVDAGILRRTGGGVQFRHRLLADHLAEDAPQPGLMDLRLEVGGD